MCPHHVVTGHPFTVASKGTPATQDASRKFSGAGEGRSKK